MILFGQSRLLETNGFWPALLESKTPIGWDCLVHFSDRQLPKQTNDLRPYFAEWYLWASLIWKGLHNSCNFFMREWPSCWSPFEWATTMLYIIWSNRFCIWKNPDSFEIVWKNPDSFKIIPKFGNHLENSTQFWNCQENGKWSGKKGWFWNIPENGKWSGKICTVLKPSGKLAVIWINPDSFETVRKIGNDLEKSEIFWKRP